MRGGFTMGIAIDTVMPAYTSLIGKVKYTRPLGTSIHHAASYVIGRREMGFDEKVPSYIVASQKIQKTQSKWKRIYKAAKNIPDYVFRNKKLPVLKNWKSFNSLVTC